MLREINDKNETEHAEVQMQIDNPASLPLETPIETPVDTPMMDTPVDMFVDTPPQVVETPKLVSNESNDHDHHEDEEKKKDEKWKNWRKTAMMIWQKIADHKYGNVFLHNKQESLAGYF